MEYNNWTKYTKYMENTGMFLRAYVIAESQNGIEEL